MKIQIDTDNKIIRLEEKINFGQFMTTIKKILPQAWMSFELDCQPIYNWTNPIIIEKPIYPHQPLYPATTPDIIPYPWITWCDNTSNKENPYKVNFNSGTYNIEI